MYNKKKCYINDAIYLTMFVENVDPDCLFSQKMEQLRKEKRNNFINYSNFSYQNMSITPSTFNVLLRLIKMVSQARNSNNYSGYQYQNDYFYI